MTRQPRRVASNLLAGLLVALLVLGAGVTYVLGQPVRYTATSSFVVFPAAVNADNAASYYETLARGQIVSTLAQIVSARQSQEDDGTVVEVVPETSLITLTATESSASRAEQVAGAQMEAALVTVRDLKLPFAVRPVSTGAGTAATSSASSTTLLGVVVTVSLVLGLIVQETLAALTRRRRANALR